MDKKLGRRLITVLALLCLLVMISAFIWHLASSRITLYGAKKKEISDMNAQEKFTAIFGEEAEDEIGAGKLNVNTASVSELVSTCGISETLAKNIFAYRLYNGDFSKLDELLNVTGMGEKTYQSIRDFLTVK